jgi:hypothetical protein
LPYFLASHAATLGIASLIASQSAPEMPMVLPLGLFWAGMRERERSVERERERLKVVKGKM